MHGALFSSSLLFFSPRPCTRPLLLQATSSVEINGIWSRLRWRILLPPWVLYNSKARCSSTHMLVFNLLLGTQVFNKIWICLKWYIVFCRLNTRRIYCLQFVLNLYAQIQLHAYIQLVQITFRLYLVIFSQYVLQLVSFIRQLVDMYHCYLVSLGYMFWFNF